MKKDRIFAYSSDAYRAYGGRTEGVRRAYGGRTEGVRGHTGGYRGVQEGTGEIWGGIA